MRFAYIDSQGKEVSIPSVDALRLRIELGAIVDGTMFHDANTGKWARAAEHEIYRTLKRELTELGAGTFVAPPPPGGKAPPASRSRTPASPPAPLEQLGAEAGAAGPGPRPDGEGSDPPPADPPVPSGPAEAEPPRGDLGLGFDVELVPEPHRLEEAMDAPGPQATSEPEVPAMEGLDLEPDLSAEWGEAEWEDEDIPPLDDPTSTEERIPLVASAMDEIAPSAPTDPGEEVRSELPSPEPEAGAGPAERGPDPLDGLDLEPTLAEVFESGPQPPPAGGGLDAPVSPFDEDQPPDWVYQEGPADWSKPETEDSGRDTAPAEPVGAPAPPPSRRPRSAPPPRKLTRAGTPGAGRVIALILVAVVVAAGGWYGWDYVAGRSGGGDTRPQAPSLPELPADLIPQFREVTAGALAETIETVATLPERTAIPAGPNREWLAGVYLAGASAFPDVADYWQRILAYADAAESAEEDAFRSAFQSRLGALELPEDDARQLQGRGLAGWNAADPERHEVYEQLRAVASAALELHEFVLANEDQITYEPAAGGVSRDPVLEAVPETEALGEAMWDRVGAITEALDELGYLDTINTDGLLGRFLDKLAAVPVS